MPEWDNNRTGGGDRGGGNWGGQGGGRGNDNNWNRDNEWNRGGHDRDRDWDRGRYGNDWNRGWDWDDWYKPKKHYKKRRYNYYPGNPWWYPYWNQWVAPIVNPIFSWFQPYPYQTTYQPSVLYP